MKLLCATSFLLAVLLFTSHSVSAQPLVGYVTLPEMKAIKKDADHAARAAVSQLDSSAGQVLKKKIAAKLATKAAENADVAGEYVGLVQAGEKVSREKAKVCADVAKTVMSAVEALAKNETGKAGDLLGKTEYLAGNLSSSVNAMANYGNVPNASQPASRKEKSRQGESGTVLTLENYPFIPKKKPENSGGRRLTWREECPPVPSPSTPSPPSMLCNWEPVIEPDPPRRNFNL